MWVVMDDGNAVENRTGDELYTDYVNGIVNVYRNEKKNRVVYESARRARVHQKDRRRDELSCRLESCQFSENCSTGI